MKSIKQQYIDLREGRMTQQNFMRSLRQNLPQYITNVTSYNDSIKILKNKGILNEADIREKNLDVDQEELKKGIEVEKEHTDDPVKAEEIALDHLSEDPKYYTKLAKVGLEENEEELSPRMKQIQKSMGDMGKKPITPERRAELEKVIKAQREKEKAGLKEAKDEKGKWTNVSGKSMYDQFKEINKLNGQEVLIGIDYEMQKNHELTKTAAAKIVLKNLKKNPIYYTAEYMSGVEGYEPEYLGGKSAQPEAWQMQPVKGDNMVDKKMGMKPVKNIAKAKKDADAKKETNVVVKGVEELTFTAKTVRGLQKFDATGEKMKTIHESVDKALAKERLKEIIRQELKEITGAYGGDAMDAEDGSSYLEQTGKNNAQALEYAKHYAGGYSVFLDENSVKFEGDEESWNLEFSLDIGVDQADNMYPEEVEDELTFSSHGVEGNPGGHYARSSVFIDEDKETGNWIVKVRVYGGLDI